VPRKLTLYLLLLEPRISCRVPVNLRPQSELAEQIVLALGRYPSFASKIPSGIQATDALGLGAGARSRARIRV